jgi:GNAT superfamily N-acetyltransferase
LLSIGVFICSYQEYREGAFRMDRPEPVLRIATPDDAPRIQVLMQESAAAIFPRFYSERQAASAVRYVAQVDPMLLADGTYFVLETRGELVACGGWSRRARPYTGSGDSDGDARLLDPATEPAVVRAMFVRDDWTRRGLGRRIIDECEAAARAEGFDQLALTATLPGVPLYVACGFEPIEELEISLCDDVRVGCVSMEKRIEKPAYDESRSSIPSGLRKGATT